MIAGMMRVKNEARWIERCVRSILPVCDYVVIMDDHSTDGTAEICRMVPGVSVFGSPFTGLDEARDKNWLLDKVLAHQPEWIVAIDGDEMLAESGIEPLRAAMASTATCLSFRVLYLWDRENQVRVDGVYGDFHRESAFRPNGAPFVATSNGGNFHCGNVPWSARRKRTVLHTIPLLHFGYLHKEDRVRKYEWYNAKDPGNVGEDCYRHMVVGDVFPADAKFQHGGPLSLQSIKEVA